AGQYTFKANLPGQPASIQSRANPPTFRARHQGNKAKNFARKMAGRDSGRVSTQIRLPASRSRPNPSVAKLRVHNGIKKVVNRVKTMPLEKTENPEASKTMLRCAAQAR